MARFDQVALDGRIVPLGAAVLPVTDHGLLRGDGVFEVIRLYDGVPFALDEHLARMAVSAANLRLPLDLAAVESDVRAVLAANEPGDCALRLVVTRGGHRLAMFEALPAYDRPLRLRTVTFSPTRILDGVKSLSYAGNMLATRLAQEQGADEALLVTPHGRVLEAPTSTFFYVVDGEGLCTPPLDDHILDSITRRHVLAVTDAHERVTTRDDIPRMREAFLASTLREVQAVAHIDDHDLPATGASTAAAAARVGERIRQALA